jgi:preprotein translocase subunit SecG
MALSVLLIGVIILQQNEASLGGAFGGDDAAGAKHTRRGLEKLLFQATIGIALLFVLSSLLALFI